MRKELTKLEKLYGENASVDLKYFNINIMDMDMDKPNSAINPGWRVEGAFEIEGLVYIAPEDQQNDEGEYEFSFVGPDLPELLLKSIQYINDTLDAAVRKFTKAKI